MGLDDDVWGEVIGAIIVWSADTDDDAKTPQALQQWMDGRIAPYAAPTRVPGQCVTHYANVCSSIVNGTDRSVC